jgi:two-component system response regulator AtoC
MAKVLIVDDEADLREVLIQRLRRSGHTVTGAISAEDGLALASAETFDLILLDVSLPGISGLSAIERFASRTKAPVVIMSGHADSEMAKDALLLGAKAFFPKPPDFAALDLFLKPPPEPI